MGILCLSAVVHPFTSFTSKSDKHQYFIHSNTKDNNKCAVSHDIVESEFWFRRVQTQHNSHPAVIFLRYHLVFRSLRCHERSVSLARSKLSRKPAFLLRHQRFVSCQPDSSLCFIASVRLRTRFVSFPVF